MKKFLFGLIAALPLLALGVVPTRASVTSPVVASYVAGWNMVGGPPGTDFSSASEIDAYGPNGYIASAANPLGCQGYWALFARPTTITLPAGAFGPIQACPLQAGWNLVGDPFSGLAVLPAGTTAYHWNPDRGTYDVVSQLQPGTSVWIYAAASASLTLTYAPLIPPTPFTLDINSLAQTGAYTIHVGDSVQLLLPAATPYTATTDPSLLALEIAGLTGPATCNGTCAITLYDQIWIWHAVAPGATQIVVSPLCNSMVPPCGQPSTQITINIIP